MWRAACRDLVNPGLHNTNTHWFCLEFQKIPWYVDLHWSTKNLYVSWSQLIECAMKWVFTEAILAVRTSFIVGTQLTMYFYLLFVNIRGRDMWGRWILSKSFILLSCLCLSDAKLDGCLRVWIADLLLYLSFKDSLKRDGNRTRKNKARGWFSACHCCTTISLHEMFSKPSLCSMPAFQNNSPDTWQESGTEYVFVVLHIAGSLVK